MNKGGTFKIIENWKLTLRDSVTNEIMDIREVKNTVTNIAKGLIRDWLYGGGSGYPTALAIGTGTTSPTAGDTTLETEYARETATPSKPSSYVVKYAKTFTFLSGTSETITESGLFDSVIESNSNMFARTTFAGISITESTNLSVEAEITISGT